ncbi:MAG TPA: SDR family NAD(P)-dependent oxidoreductase [Xanthobacteraceae bacterium]|nr:SDR family NAD(P)-dependent oxidoreductase [Xanthobacteraceae bacterium]
MAKTNGKTALITGSTDGVGRMVAERLGEAGWRVLVHGRDRARGEEVVAHIKKAGGKAEFIGADLSSLAEVRRLADAIQKTTKRLDLLINNAGIGSGGPQGARQTSADGYELRFAVNYLSGFLLTYLLLPLLKQSAPARIVNVASLGQQAIDFDDVMLTKDYSGMRAYRQSKLAQILFSIDLAAELAGSRVTVNVLHPATFMDTKMVREFGTPMSTVAEGAEAILKLAVAPELEGRSGLYFNGKEEARANEQAYEAQARAKLKARSLELAGLSTRKSASARRQF